MLMSVLECFTKFGPAVQIFGSDVLGSDRVWIFILLSLRSTDCPAW